MTRKELIDKLVAAATEVYDPREAAAVARLVAEKRFGLSRADIALEPEAEVDLSAEAVDWFSRQISAGRPVQYILGEADFCDMQLIVGEGVLIPRPETEELVRWVSEDVQASSLESLTPARAELSACENSARRLGGRQTDGFNEAENRGGMTDDRFSRKILDLCTGSGAIAIALARVLPRARVVAVDNSPEALDFARRNNRKYDAGVEFVEGDVLCFDGPQPPLGGPSTTFSESRETFDVIVANPPYIPEAERVKMAPNVTDHEPAGALFVPDNDPLVFYRAIARLARKLLRPAGGNGRSEGELRDTNLGSPQPPKGEPTACQCKPKTPHAAALYLEINEDLADETVELLRTEGFTQVTVREDINGKKRMIKAEN